MVLTRELKINYYNINFMKTMNVYLRSFLHALTTAIYVFLVAWLMSSGEKFFGNTPAIFAATSVLLLFTVSAAITGYLIAGKAILMYWDGLKKEAIKMFYLTISWLVLLAVLILVTRSIF